MNSPSKARPEQGAIGLFDSGVGGLSVLRHVQSLLPREKILYLADQAHVPYGQRSPDEVRRLSESISRFLLDQGAKIVVVACNAASAAALDYLRAVYPSLPIVGMEPAVKPAAAGSRKGIIGILATPGTFDSQRYARLMTRYARDVQVLEDPCLGLVEQIETGRFEGDETRHILEHALAPMIEAGIDTVVLGCTHYPLVTDLIRQIVGPGVAIVDPAPAVARQVRRVIEEKNLSNRGEAPGSLRLFSTGPTDKMAVVAGRFSFDSLPIEQAIWQSSALHLRLASSEP